MAFVSSLPEETVGPTVWELHPEAYSAWPDICVSIMASDSELTLGEKELIGAYSSALRGCRHCYTAHYPVAVAYGIDQSLFQDMMKDPEDAPVDKKTKALLVFVKKLCDEPTRFSRTDIEHLMAAGWSEQTASDAIKMSGLFAFMNVMMIGHGADDVDLTDIGPVHAIIRGRGKYGHGEGTGRQNVLLVMRESISKYGLFNTLKAIRRGRQLGVVGNKKKKAHS